MITENREDGTYLVFRVYYTDGNGEYEEYSVLLPAGNGGTDVPEHKEIYYVYVEESWLTATVCTDINTIIQDYIIGTLLYVGTNFGEIYLPITEDMLEYDTGIDASKPGTIEIEVYHPEDRSHSCTVYIELRPDLDAFEKLATYEIAGMLRMALCEGEEGVTLTTFAGDEMYAAILSPGYDEYDYICAFTYYDEDANVIRLTIEGVDIAVTLDEENMTVDFYQPKETAVTYTYADYDTNFSFLTPLTESGEYLCITTQETRWYDEEKDETVSAIISIAYFCEYDAKTKCFYSPFEDEFFLIGDGNELSIAPVVALVVMNDICDDATTEKAVVIVNGTTIADFLALYLPELDEGAVFLVNYEIVDSDYILKAEDLIWVAPQNGMIVSLSFLSETTYLIVPVDCTVQTLLGMYGIPTSAIVTVNGEAAWLDTVLKAGDAVLVATGEANPEEKPGEQEKPEGIPEVMESMGKLNRGDLLENVTITMTGTNPQDFDYTFLFDGKKALMTDNTSEDTEYYEDEWADAVRTAFVAPVLAILEHSNYFYADEKGYICDREITYECEILGAGLATITAYDIVVVAEGDTLLSITCNMHQVCEEDELDVTVTFTFSNYGTTVVTAPSAE